MKKRWSLLIPDWSGLDDIWRNPKPFCLWPVGNQPFLGHWLDEAVSRGIDSIDFFVSDRPSMVRDFLDGGSYWSKDICVTPLPGDDAAPDDAIPIVGLPRDNKIHARLGSSADLLKHWLHINLDWLKKIDDYELRIENPLCRQGWIGPHSRISPKANLIPPYWIQGKCDIADRATIGPYACICENTIIDENAIVRNSIALPGTLIGRNTSLNQVAVDGGLLLDVKRGSRIRISDAFILSDLASPVRTVPLRERLFAMALYLSLAPIIALSRIDWSLVEVHDGRGGAFSLKTGQSGRLLFRRWHWLKEVFKGRMRLIGILPRPIDWELREDRELSQRLRESAPGFLSLSDLHDCHDASDPDEWVHASYQALNVEKYSIKLVRNNFWKLALKRFA